MSEKDTNNYEVSPSNVEALKESGAERSAELSKERESKAKEQEQGKSVETLKAEAHETAANAEKQSKKETAPAEKKKDRPVTASKKAKDASFKRTMKETQSHMKPASRAFSKTIHNKAVEKTSEVVGATIARPNAILSGSVAAFLLTLVIFIIARRNGYPLSGFESIAAFIIGWVIGNLFDYLRVMVTGKKA